MRPAAVQPLIDALAGKRAGFGETLRLLQQDPCQPALGAYRLSGPLAPTVCGAHLKRGFRIAFTMQPAASTGERPRVVILYVGKRTPRHGSGDIWEILHDLFGVENPPADHHKPACCDAGKPEISDEGLDDFTRRLRRMSRNRR